MNTDSETTDPWPMRGSCYQSFDLRFFGSDDEQAEVQQEYCDDCQVRPECRMFADMMRERVGTWGGKTMSKRWRRSNP